MGRGSDNCTLACEALEHIAGFLFYPAALLLVQKITPLL
jgi:hypothetical protein